MSAWTVIAHTEVGSGGASSITFMSVGNIPSTYTDLVILASIRSTASEIGGDMLINFNDSTTGYSARQLFGSGSSASSESSTTSGQYGGFLNGATSTANTFMNTMIYIPNYSGSTNKSVSVDTVNENNATTAYAAIQATLWSNTAAITKIVLSRFGGSNFAQYSSATLYGITKGSSGGVVVS